MSHYLRVPIKIPRFFLPAVGRSTAGRKKQAYQRVFSWDPPTEESKYTCNLFRVSFFLGASWKDIINMVTLKEV